MIGWLQDLIGRREAESSGSGAGVPAALSSRKSLLDLAEQIAFANQYPDGKAMGVFTVAIACVRSDPDHARALIDRLVKELSANEVRVGHTCHLMSLIGGVMGTDVAKVGMLADFVLEHIDLLVQAGPGTSITARHSPASFPPVGSSKTIDASVVPWDRLKAKWLTIAGHDDQAHAFVATLQRGSEQTEALRGIVGHLAKLGAQDRLDRALAMPVEIDLSGYAYELMALQQQRDERFAEAEATAQRLGDPTKRSVVLVRLSVAVAQAGLHDEARRLLDVATDIFPPTADTQNHLSGIARALAHLGDVARFESVAAMINENTDGYGYLSRYRVIAQLIAGNLTDGLALFLDIPPARRIFTISTILQGWLGARPASHDIEHFVATIDEPVGREYALSAIGEAAVKAGDISRADECLARIMRETETRLHATALHEGLILDALEQGNTPRALEIVTHYGSVTPPPRLLAMIAERLP